MAKDKKILDDWSSGEFVVGLDEVGRGCGAGPVVTAAVIMPKNFKSPLIRDSKKLTEKQRQEAYELIQKNAISIACNAGSVTDIDELGINKATFKCMHKCLDDLSVKPDYILVDGNVWDDYTGINADNKALSLIPKGDDTYTCIAAAAIIAKVRRDEYMTKLHSLYPQYNWASNKGYLTPDHIAALKEFGRNRYHRSVFIRNFLGLSPKEYRKLLVENCNTVEQLMCAKEWSKIDYSKLPSKAMSDLMKAFSKNDLARFQEYLTSVEKGEAKINAGAVYPYDIIKNMKQGNTKGANVQWDALPNYLENSSERFMPVVDVSGSMSCPAGGNNLITCMDVAISLGLYISERNVGPFKDAFVTFSSNPSLQVLSGSLSERYEQLRRAEWSMSTNVEAVFKLILSKAKASKVSEDEMPTMILILSDMEFDRGTEGNLNKTAQESFEKNVCCCWI